MRVVVMMIAAVAAIGVLQGSAASADEQRQIGGYQVVAAFQHTPVYPGEMNGLVLTIATPAGQPAVGLDQSLRMRVGVPHQVTETWQLTADPARPGVYTVGLLLPRAGTYFLDLIGTIDGQSVSERFVTGQNGLDKVITHGRQYPNGSWIVIVVTFGGYLVGLAILLSRAGLARHRAHRRRSLGV